MPPFRGRTRLQPATLWKRSPSAAQAHNSGVKDWAFVFRGRRDLRIDRG
jgi:hypothetical protein